MVPLVPIIYCLAWRPLVRAWWQVMASKAWQMSGSMKPLLANADNSMSPYCPSMKGDKCIQCTTQWLHTCAQAAYRNQLFVCVNKVEKARLCQQIWRQFVHCITFPSAQEWLIVICVAGDLSLISIFNIYFHHTNHEPYQAQSQTRFIASGLT